MFNKSIAFGLVAAGLMIVPTAAFAGGRQSQSSEQVTIQEGAAVHGSTSAQTSRSVNVQNHTQNRAGRRSPSYSRHGRGYCAGTSQSARSRQETIQTGAAVGGSLNAQDSRTTNVQRGRVSGC